MAVDPVPTESSDPPETETPTQGSKWALQDIIKIAAGSLVAVILVIFLAGVALALFANADEWSLKVQIIRDIFIIILALQGIIVVVALAVLILQIARLINLIQHEVMPILENTQETLNTAKGTVEFVSSNVTEPVLRTAGFIAGFRVLVGELGGIRRAVRPENNNGHEKAER